MIRSLRSKSLRKFAADGDASKRSVQNPARTRWDGEDAIELNLEDYR